VSAASGAFLVEGPQPLTTPVITGIQTSGFARWLEPARET
jgi:hypothetical protein